MKKYLLLFFIICGLAKICELPFQISPDFDNGYFFTPDDEEEEDDDDDDDSMDFKFPETSTINFNIKSQCTFAAYLHDIFWLGKNKYI